MDSYIIRIKMDERMYQTKYDTLKVASQRQLESLVFENEMLLDINVRLVEAQVDVLQHGTTTPDVEVEVFPQELWCPGAQKSIALAPMGRFKTAETRVVPSAGNGYIRTRHFRSYPQGWPIQSRSTVVNAAEKSQRTRQFQTSRPNFDEIFPYRDLKGVLKFKR